MKKTKTLYSNVLLLSNKLGLFTMSSKIKPITIYLLIGVLIILISIKAAFGYQEDFNAYALSKNLYICACSHTENTLTVENTGDVASTYSVKQEGTAMPFSSLSPTTFTLKPGETKQIHNFINVPCGIEGKYNLITIIDTIFGTSKELVQEIEVKKCINIDLSLKEQPAEVCPCTPAKYTFIIKNTGDFTETYYIEAAPTPKYVSISEKVVVLEAGKSKEIYVFVNAPCGFFGEQEYSLIATTQKSKVKAELPFKTIIAPCYDYSITSPDYFLVCSDLKNTYSLLISNNANVANSYYLSSDSNWVFFDQPYINLSKKQNTQANVTFYPVALPKGEYNVTLRSVSERGQLVVEKPVIANVDNCYSLNLSLEQIAPAVSCEQVITKVLVNNDGAKENTYTLSLIGEPWAGISLTSLSLKPGEIKESLIKFDVPCDAYGTYHFSILGSMSNFPEKVLQQPLDLVIQSPEEAYAIEINSVDDKIETNYDGAVIPLTISSKGIRAGYYDLLLDTDQEWMYLDKQSINLGIGDNQTISLILSPSNETLPGNYEISIKAIPKDKGIGYERQFVVKLREKTLGETLIEVWPYLLLGLLIPVLLAVLIILIIYKSKKKKEEDFWKVVEGEPSKVIETVKEEPKRLVYVKKERKWLRILLITLITLLLVGTFALVIYYFTPSTEEVEEGANETGITEANITEIPSESKEEANITEEGIFHKMYSYAHNWISNKYRQIFAEEVEEEKPQENISEEVKLEEFEELGIENATIYINRTGLRGEGNIIEIGPDEEIIIPITIQNNYEPNIYRIKVNKNVSWIDVDKNEVEIPPNQKEAINLIVGPTKATEEGNYKIDIV
ncbi:MAG: hypothetical protein N3D84_00965, partial [Candidatus Woesearchaeota archaeon]|nr:hypothetical protein [Candidatus Woesearchaeota archaeon]